jgi:hypothetical protein
VKTTLSMRTTANPRRTTLADLADTDEFSPEATASAENGELPAQTANPRRTVLMELPGA